MNTLLYFAYGSNLSTPRLLARVSSARIVTRAQLVRHTLEFHKQGRDGSAKCDAYATERAEDVVHGAVFRLPTADKAILDVHEGLGNGYEQKWVTLLTPNGTTLEALTYYASVIDPALRPFDWYRQHVLFGAREQGLPAEYIAGIEAVAAITDPNPARRARELAVYG